MYFGFSVRSQKLDLIPMKHSKRRHMKQWFSYRATTKITSMPGNLFVMSHEKVCPQFFFNIKNKLSEIISEMSERERGKCWEFFLIPAVIKTLSLNTFSQILIWWVTCSCNIHSNKTLLVFYCHQHFKMIYNVLMTIFLMNSSTSFDRVPKDIWPSWCVYNWKRRIVLPRIDERCGQVTRRERSV